MSAISNVNSQVNPPEVDNDNVVRFPNREFEAEDPLLNNNNEIQELFSRLSKERRERK